MDFKVKSSIPVDVATHVFNFYLPLISMITNIIEKSKKKYLLKKIADYGTDMQT